MSFFSFFRPKPATASVAKERLQIILAHERSGSSTAPDFLPQLRQEILAVVSKYVNIPPDHIQLTQDRQGTLDVLEVKIEIPPQEPQTVPQPDGEPA